MNKSKKVILAASMATILAIGVGTSLAIGNNNAIRADAAATEITEEVSFKKASNLPEGYSITKEQGGTKYLKITNGATLTVNKTALFKEADKKLVSDMNLNLAVGTFGTWNAKSKDVAINASFVDQAGTVLTTVSNTYSNLSSSEIYRGDFTLAKPTNVDAIENLKIDFELLDDKDILRLADFKATYSMDDALATTEPDFAYELSSNELYDTESATLTINYNNIYVGTPSLTIDVTKGSELVDVTVDGLTATIASKGNAGDVELSITVADAEGHTVTKTASLSLKKVLSVGEFKALPQSNDKVQFKGVVVDSTDKEMWICDEQGNGVSFFSKKLNSFSNLAVNNEVIITGSRGEHDQKAQVSIASNDDVKVLGTKTLAPKKITKPSDINGFDYCGNYVELSDVTFDGLPKDTDGPCDFVFTHTPSGEKIQIHANDGKFDSKTKLISLLKTLNNKSSVTLTGIADMYETKIQIKLTNNVKVSSETLSAEGLAFAKSFLSNLTCDATGKTAPNQEKWLELKAKFDKLPAGDKAIYKKLSSSTSDEGKAVERYDYILTKYGKDTYVDFMDRNPSTSLTYTPFVENNEILIITMVAICVTTVSAIAIFAIVKHKKSQVK